MAPRNMSHPALTIIDMDQLRLTIVANPPSSTFTGKVDNSIDHRPEEKSKHRVCKKKSSKITLNNKCINYY